MAKSLYVIGNSTLIEKRKEDNQPWQNQSLSTF